MIKFIKRKDRQFPKQKTKNTMIMPRNYKLFVGVALIKYLEFVRITGRY